MTRAEKFRAASEAAESWLNTLTFIPHYGKGKQPDVEELYPMLIPIPPRTPTKTDWESEGAKRLLRLALAVSVAEHQDAILDAEEDLNAHTKGDDIVWPKERRRTRGEVYPKSWTNATTAALGMARLALNRLVDPLTPLTIERLKLWADGKPDPDAPVDVASAAKKFEQLKGVARKLLRDRWREFEHLTSAYVKPLMNRIQVERAKVLKGWGAAPLAPESKTQPVTPPPRVTVDLARRQVTVDGKVYDAPRSLNALRWVKVLAEHPGEWIPGLELCKYDPELPADIKTHRLKQYLPKQLVKLIQSHPSKGSRIALTRP